jgi:hypothetical protein
VEKAVRQGRLMSPDFPRARGVGRMADNVKAVLVYFDRRLTDDEMRKLHMMLNERVANYDFGFPPRIAGAGISRAHELIE